jgi:chromosome segregation ATPase
MSDTKEAYEKAVALMSIYALNEDLVPPIEAHVAAQDKHIDAQAKLFQSACERIASLESERDKLKEEVAVRDRIITLGQSGMDFVIAERDKLREQVAELESALAETSRAAADSGAKRS